MKTAAWLALSLVLTPLGALPATAQQGSPAQQMPADVFCYAEVDAGALERGLQQLDLAELLSDPEFTNFFLPLFEQVGVNPEQPVASLLQMAPVRQYLAGNAAIGLRGLSLWVEHPGGETRIEVSPSSPVTARRFFDLLGLVGSIEMENWDLEDLNYEIGLDAVAVLDPGPAFRQHVSEILEHQSELKWLITDIHTDDLAGRSVTHFSLNPEVTGAAITDLYADLNGSRWVITTTRDTFEDVVGVTASQSLASSPTYVVARERMASVDPVIFGFADAAQEIAIVRNFIPPILAEAADIAGISSLRGSGFALSMTEGGVRESIGLLLDGQPQGMWRILEAMPGGIEALDRAPADALALVSVKFDPAIFLDRTKDLLRALMPGTEERIEAEIAGGLQQVGVDLRRDILDTLGDEVTLVQYAPAGMLSLPDWVLLVKVKHEGNARALLAKVQGMAAQMGAPVRFQPVDAEGGVAAERVIVEGLPMPPPILAIHNGYLALSSRPDLLAEATVAWGNDPSATLANGSENFEKTMRGLSGGQTGNIAMLAYLDIEKLLPPLLSATLGMAPAEIVDLGYYPDLERFSDHFSGAAVALRRDDHGITLDSFSPTGVLIPGMIAAAMEQRGHFVVASGGRLVNDANALNTQAWNIVNRTGQSPSEYATALDLAHTAIQLDPGNHYYLNTLGVAHYRVGHYQDAVRTLTRADELNQASNNQYNRATDLLFIGMAQWKLGNHDSARTMLDGSRALVEGSNDGELLRFLQEAETLMGSAF